ncbi:MAG: hypothetical protein M9927_07705 [Anaerolineae bacterium]|nr:hypothetical protein [Anaerolineae bacterium]
MAEAADDEDDAAASTSYARAPLSVNLKSSNFPDWSAPAMLPCWQGLDDYGNASPAQ